MGRRRAHYVLSTHWDREWYQTFQDYRFRLVQLFDRVLDGLAEGRLKGPFQTDGQAIVIEDYLEVRPERRAQVMDLVRQRKLVVGPWYVMPDEFIVSGESLVRNLRYGRELVRSWGGRPSDAGFVCDIFGHNSQMPQIFAGFGIPGGLIWRGTNLVGEFLVRWRGADGTELPCYRFGHGGYCTFAFDVRHARETARPADLDAIRKELEDYVQNEAQGSEVDPLLIFDGGDHQEWDQAVYRAVADRIAHPQGDVELVHTSLDDYLAEMVPQAERIKTVVEGELREPGLHPVALDQQYLIPGVLSSREWIKMSNAECQTLLCQWAEPWSALAQSAVGLPYPQGYLDVAWRWLLQNHPHDSICGCSIDAVHEDMKYRFHQCRDIADRLTVDATRKLGASIQGEVGEDELRVVVFNPLPTPVDETTELTLEIPSEWPTFNEFFGFEPKPAFRIYDAEGQELPYQRLGQAMRRTKKRIHPTAFPERYVTNDIRVSLPLRVPALGYTTLTVRRPDTVQHTRHALVPGLATSERSMANELLSVVIESNGTLTLTDKRTGAVYSRLLTLEECADIGDGWYHGQASNDQVFVSSASQASVALVHDGPMLTTFRVRVSVQVPAEFCFDSMTRSPQLVELIADSLVSLRPGADRVEVETTILNTAKDHRLRMLFPSGAAADTYLADTPFDVVERPIALRKDMHLYRELEVETKPQQSWSAVYDSERGLAVVSFGLLESAVRDLPERPIALTLLRGTRRTVMTDGEPEGQLLGAMTFRYWIVPLQGAPDRVRLCLLGQQLAAGLRAAQLCPSDIALERQQATLAPEAGMLALEGQAVLTSLRRVGASLEVRMFNPSEQPSLVKLDISGWPASQQRPIQGRPVDLESKPLGESMAFQDGTLRVPLAPKQIVTLSLS